jgi:hydrogenase maturation factor
LKEAQLAGRIEGVVAMHDVTEGGLATALLELSFACGHEIHVDIDKIPFFPETKKICRLFDLDPLGLIGSGSLLICSRKKTLDKLIDDIKKAGVRITPIGEILDKGKGIKAIRQGAPVEWPDFEVDEITRLF